MAVDLSLFPVLWIIDTVTIKKLREIGFLRFALDTMIF
jgi:hypothetical protein